MKSRPNKKTLMALFGMASTTKADFNGMGSVDCLQNGFTYILGSETTDLVTDGQYDFTKGGCCEFPEDPEEIDDEICKEDCSGENSAFCISQADGINNNFLQEFLQISSDAHCSTNTHIRLSESGEENLEIVNIPFDGVLPNADALNWHCKWKVEVESSLVQAGVDTTLEER